jgi:hypothetical protein
MTTEQLIREQALDHPCPTCGAAEKIRCRIVTHRPARPGYPKGTVVDVKKTPCPERATLAWRAMLAAGDDVWR